MDKNTNSKRFDINILINGIPIIHIELKNESIDLKQAMKQIVNYKNNGAISDFLDFTKIFIYSNGTNTRYFVNNNNKNNNSSFTWSDKNNKNANELLEFSNFFLNKSFLIDFIFNYFVMDDEKLVIKIFRPYQYHACKEILNRIDGNEKQKSGYI
ncbi:MAG: type I restriction endonuclease [Clostridia bacterium]